MVEILAKGRAVVGAGSVDITPSDTQPMAGFSWAGQMGHPGTDRLFCRVVYLRDVESGEEAVLAFFDLMSASLALHQRIAHELATLGHARLAAALVTFGTHTHTAPGRFYGATFYDSFAQKPTLDGYQELLVAGWARLAASEILAAKTRAREVTLAVARDVVVGLGRNRSLVAHARNFDPRFAPPLQPSAGAILQNDIDPRVTLLLAYDASGVVASAAFHGCHPTTLGPSFTEYHRDWPGVAVEHIERALGGVACFGQGPLGDVSPDPAQFGDLPQSLALATAVGQRFATAVLRLARAAQAGGEGATPLPISLDSGTFSVQQWGSEPRFVFGVPALGGSEDGGSALGNAPLGTVGVRIGKFLAEGFRGGPGPHYPKAPALGPIQALCYGPLELSPYHPWHRLRLGEHCLLTLPGEPTTMAAREYELAALERLEVSSANVVGCAGDYTGYYTTPAEYDAQQYEGASTLFGRHALDEFIERALGPSSPIPARGEPEPHDLPRLPVRDVESLERVAYETRGSDSARLVFGVPKSSLGVDVRATLVGPLGRTPLVVRPEWHPDPDGAPTLRVLSARLGEGNSLGGAHLEVSIGASQTRRAIVTHARAEPRFRPPSSHGGWVLATPFWPMLALVSWSMLGLAVGMFAPAWLLTLCGVTSGAENALLVRMSSLTFLLLSTNLLFSKNSQDAHALFGHARAGLLFWSVLLVLVALAAATGGTVLLVWAALYALFGLAFCLWFERALARRIAGRPVTSGESTEFTRPLITVLSLTAIVGTAFVVLGWLLVPWLFQHHDRTTLALFMAYGLGFWVNTLSMLGSRMSVDPRVLRGQFLGSLLFDATTVVLLALAIASAVVTKLGLVLAVPYLVITVWFPRLDARARRLVRGAVDRPRSRREIRDVIAWASATRSHVRVVGSGHSVPAAISADNPASQLAPRPSVVPDRHLQLDRLNRIINVDRWRRRVTVEAGMHLGPAPGSPESLHASLVLHLDRLALALPDLGGIVHQSVAGFLATGSAGGSTKYDASSAVVEMRLMDGTGAVRVLRRSGRTRPDFEAALASVGLFGVVIEATFACEPEYMVTGVEYVATVNAAGVLELPAPGTIPDSVQRPAQIALAARNEFANYLQSIDYSRVLWWPQANVNKMAIWEGRRGQGGGSVEPYHGDARVMQRVAGLILGLVGRSYGGGMTAVVGRAAMKLFPRLIPLFLPDPPKRFYAKWYDNLPMDTNVDDFVMPVEFTELWFDVEDTHLVMAELLELYADPENAGAFACELYLGAATPAWLGASQNRPCFRVDLFWFKNNGGDPGTDYYPTFWRKLASFGFRPHLGKYLPPHYSAEGHAHLASVLPRLPLFRFRRLNFDPNDVFVSRYWRDHFRL